MLVALALLRFDQLHKLAARVGQISPVWHTRRVKTLAFLTPDAGLTILEKAFLRFQAGRRLAPVAACSALWRALSQARPRAPPRVSAPPTATPPAAASGKHKKA